MKMLLNLVSNLLPRRLRWRAGRALYLQARRETPDYNIESNGEARIQECVLSANAQSDTAIVIFDIGANVGDWTLSMLKAAGKLGLHERVKLHVFEPVNRTFRTLAERLGAHPTAASVRLENLALSSSPGSDTMFVSDEDNAGTNSLHAKDGDGTSRQIIIKTTVRDYARENRLGLIHFLKCDTEGHDFEVLKGMTELLDREKVMVVQFEYNWRWIHSRRYLKDVFDLVQDTNYRIGKITPHGVEIFDAWHPELERFFEANYLMINRAASHWFPALQGNFDKSNTYA